MTDNGMNNAQRRALEAVRDGKVPHAHPFQWATDIPYLDVKLRTLQRLAKEKLIRIRANDRDYRRPVELTGAGRTQLVKTEEEDHARLLGRRAQDH